MQINVSIMFDKAKALEAALSSVGAEERAFLRLAVPSVDNQCTNNAEADDILRDFQALINGYYTVGDETLKSGEKADFRLMLARLCHSYVAADYAALMEFGYKLPPHDSQVLLGNMIELYMLDKYEGGIELLDTPQDVCIHHVFGFLQFGAYEIIREVLCTYVNELQKQTA